VPVAVEELAVMVSADWTPDETVMGLKVAVSPDGMFDALRTIF
jgi:hypothetical protein